MPAYSGITEISSDSKIHWTLSSFVQKFVTRRNNLASLLTLEGII